MKLWDTARRECIQTFTTHGDSVWGVRYNSAGTKLASVGEDSMVQLYGIKTD